MTRWGGPSLPAMRRPTGTPTNHQEERGQRIMTDRRFQPGNRVFDSRFGRGTYVGPYEDGPAANPPLHLVHFDGEGKPMLAFEANLEPVDEEASC